MTAARNEGRAADEFIPSALYRRLLGARFDALPRRVRELHDVTEAVRWRGRANVERGRGLAARHKPPRRSWRAEGAVKKTGVGYSR
jgi:hypothetical protein